MLAAGVDGDDLGRKQTGRKKSGKIATGRGLPYRARTVAATAFSILLCTESLR
jgi:hypothetical protein